MRITAQLIHASTDRHVWAERYDRNLEDIFAVQDEISEAIVTAVAPAFVSAEAHRADRKAPENLDAWDYAMRGNWFLSRRGKNDIAEARKLFAMALDIDPRNTMALSGLAFALCWVSNLGFEGDLDTVRKTAYDAALRAVDLDDHDASAHATLAFVFFTMRQLDAAIPECRRALSLNPNLAMAQSVLAISYSWRGDNEEALRHAELAERLSPRDPVQSMWSFARTCAEFGAGNYERSLECARKTTKPCRDSRGVGDTSWHASVISAESRRRARRKISYSTWPRRRASAWFVRFCPRSGPSAWSGSAKGCERPGCRRHSLAAARARRTRQRGIGSPFSSAMSPRTWR